MLCLLSILYTYTTHTRVFFLTDNLQKQRQITLTVLTVLFVLFILFLHTNERSNDFTIHSGAFGNKAQINGNVCVCIFFGETESESKKRDAWYYVKFRVELKKKSLWLCLCYCVAITSNVVLL